MSYNDDAITRKIEDLYDRGMCPEDIFDILDGDIPLAEIEEILEAYTGESFDEEREDYDDYYPNPGNHYYV